MAGQKDSKTLTYKILDIQSTESGIHLISVEFNDGDKSWRQPFRVQQDHPVTPEEFDAHVRRKYIAGELHPPEDPMLYLREALGSERTIVVDSPTEDQPE